MSIAGKFGAVNQGLSAERGLQLALIQQISDDTLVNQGLSAERGLQQEILEKQLDPVVEMRLIRDFRRNGDFNYVERQALD